MQKGFNSPSGDEKSGGGGTEASFLSSGMTYEHASRIYEAIEATKHELRFDLYRYAARYAGLRIEWHLTPHDARGELDVRRAAAHNAFIDSVNILSRNLSQAGHDISWRKEIGEERKVVGDFAVFLAARFGILAR